MKKYIAGAILPALLFAACTKTPEVSFTADQTEVMPGDSINFTNTSTQAAIYDWDFGDKTSSNQQNPSKAYRDSGTYYVSLIGYSDNEKKHDQETKRIRVVIPDYYARYTANGVRTTHKQGDDSLIVVPSSLKTINAGSTSYGVYTSALYNGTTVFSLTKGTLSWWNATQPTNSEFDDFFAPGSYAFSSSGVNGIAITIYDNGEYWSTYSGSGAQTTSTFSIMSATPVTSSTGEYQLRVECRFNCMVYNGSGAAKTLIGTYVGHFAND